jgi:hypothetical protein
MESFSTLVSYLKTGRYSRFIVLGTNPFHKKWLGFIKPETEVIYVSTEKDELAQLAQITFPGAFIFEKKGHILASNELLIETLGIDTPPNIMREENVLNMLISVLRENDLRDSNEDSMKPVSKDDLMQELTDYEKPKISEMNIKRPEGTYAILDFSSFTFNKDTYLKSPSVILSGSFIEKGFNPTGSITLNGSIKASYTVDFSLSDNAVLIPCKGELMELFTDNDSPIGIKIEAIT